MKIQNALKILILFIFIAGCSSAPVSPLLPKNQSYQPTDYLIGAGDKLNIFVWRNPDLSSQVTVRPDGKISSPLIDDLAVSGLPASIVAQNIEDVLKAYIREPKVSVIVSGFKGAVNQQIRVIGNATNPQSLAYREGMTLLDVMIAVQGLTEFADGDNAKLVRMIDGKPHSYTIQLESLIKGGDITKNRAVYPGDTIIIPETWF